MDFETKWRKFLFKFKNNKNGYYDLLCNNGYVGELVNLLTESQRDIDKNKKPIAKNDILLLNHAYCMSVKFDGKRYEKPILT